MYVGTYIKFSSVFFFSKKYSHCNWCVGDDVAKATLVWISSFFIFNINTAYTHILKWFFFVYNSTQVKFKGTRGHKAASLAK